MGAKPWSQSVVMAYEPLCRILTDTISKEILSEFNLKDHRKRQLVELYGGFVPNPTVQQWQKEQREAEYLSGVGSGTSGTTTASSASSRRRRLLSNLELSRSTPVRPMSRTWTEPTKFREDQLHRTNRQF